MTMPSLTSGRVSPGRALPSPTPPPGPGRGRPKHKAEGRRALRVEASARPSCSPVPRPESCGTLWKLYWPEGVKPQHGPKEASRSLPTASRPPPEPPGKLQERHKLTPVIPKARPKRKQKKLGRSTPAPPLGFTQVFSQDWAQALRDGELLSTPTGDQGIPKSCRLDSSLWRLRCVQLSVGRSSPRTDAYCTEVRNRGGNRVGAARLPASVFDSSGKSKSSIASPSGTRSPSPSGDVAQQPLGKNCGPRGSAWSARSSTASSEYASVRSTVLRETTLLPQSPPSFGGTEEEEEEEDAELDTFGEEEEEEKEEDCDDPSRRSSMPISPPTAQAWSVDAGRDAIPEEPEFAEPVNAAGVNAPRGVKSPESHGRKEALSRKKSVEFDDWEDWRSLFPLEVLDACAKFYEEQTPDDRDVRSIGVSDIGDMLHRHVHFPLSCAVLEADSPLLIAGADGGQEARLPSFTQFLDFVRGVGERVEQDSAGSLWSSDDLRHMAGVFQRHTAAGRVPIIKLFSVVEDFGLTTLNVGSAEKQKWFAGVTKRVLEREGKARKKSQPGFCSFEDVLEIVTAALRGAERDQRRQEFILEQKAQHKGGYTLLEIEDMRELHRVYSSKNDPQPLSRLTSLFSSLGVRDLSPDELQAVRDIVKVRTPMELLSSDSPTPLPVFISYMGDIFTRRIGDLQWHGDGTMVQSDLEGRTGFAAAMLRERGLPMSKGPSEFVQKAQRRRSFTMGPQPPDQFGGMLQAEDSSGRPSPPSESSQSNVSTLSLPHGGKQPGSRSSSRTTSKGPARMVSRPASQAGSRPGIVSRKNSGLASGLVSRSNSGLATRTTPRRSISHGQSARGSARASVDSGGAAVDSSGSAHERGYLGTLVLNKGLPPSDAILGRREMRATSVDLTAAYGLAQRKPKLGSPSAEEVELPGTMPSFLASAGPPQQNSRRMKTAADSQQLVAEAVAKLSWYETGDK